MINRKVNYVQLDMIRVGPTKLLEKVGVDQLKILEIVVTIFGFPILTRNKKHQGQFKCFLFHKRNKKAKNTKTFGDPKWL